MSLLVPGDPELSAHLEAADQAGLRVEIMDGVGIWELMPGIAHQEAVEAIATSMRRIGEGGCECRTYRDLSVRFPDGSLKRPDLGIWSDRPTELYGSVTEIPFAVVEVVSRGYERKDYELNPAFYLSRGVSDYVVFDPASAMAVHHVRGAAPNRIVAPAEVTLGGRCRIVLPGPVAS